MNGNSPITTITQITIISATGVFFFCVICVCACDIFVFRLAYAFILAWAVLFFAKERMKLRDFLNEKPCNFAYFLICSC